MKKISAFLIMCAIVISSTSCFVERRQTAGKSGKIPPGQAKKMNDSKSARDYAPGHNK